MDKVCNLIAFVATGCCYWLKSKAQVLSFGLGSNVQRGCPSHAQWKSGLNSDLVDRVEDDQSQWNPFTSYPNIHNEFQMMRSRFWSCWGTILSPAILRTKLGFTTSSQKRKSKHPRVSQTNNKVVVSPCTLLHPQWCDQQHARYWPHLRCRWSHHCGCHLPWTRMTAMRETLVYCRFFHWDSSPAIRSTVMITAVPEGGSSIHLWNPQNIRAHADCPMVQDSDNFKERFFFPSLAYQNL